MQDGSDAEVKCKASGDPEPQVAWKRRIGEHYDVNDWSSLNDSIHRIIVVSSANLID